jgi:hypothetical protein
MSGQGLLRSATLRLGQARLGCHRGGGCEEVVKAPELQISHLGRKLSPWPSWAMGRSVRVQDATVSHQHPVIFIPIRTACVHPICTRAYPHRAHQIEIDRAAPNPHRGPSLNLSRPTRAMLRGFGSPSLYALQRLPLPFSCASVCSASSVDLEGLHFTFILQLRTRMPSMCRPPLSRAHLSLLLPQS